MVARYLLLLATALVMTAGATREAACQEAPRGAVEMLIETAHMLPPEFRSDVLIRLADSGKIASADAARDALDEAFTFAAGAQEPIRLDWGGQSAARRISAREAARVRAFANQIDQLTLQSRALRLLAAADIERAWALEPYVRLQLPLLRCHDLLAYNVEDAYRNLAAFVSKLPEQRRFLIVQRYVSSMSSSLQVTPTAELLTKVPMSRDERSLLVSDFAFELERIADGDRAFSAAVARDHLPERIKELGTLLLWQDEDPGALVDAFRSFLVAHFGGRRCSGGHEGPDLRVTQWFNDDLRSLTVMPVEPIDYDRFTDHRVEQWSRTEETERASEFNTLAREIAVTLGPNRRLASALPSFVPYLKTPEAVVGDVLVWHGVGERSVTDFMLKKASLLESLLNGLSPDDFLREIVLDELVTFLAGLGQVTDDRLAWFFHVNALLDYLRRTNDAEREKIVSGFQNSGNLVMMAYASLERLTSRIP